MAHPFFGVLVALSYVAAPRVDLHAQSKDPISCMKSNAAMILIADVPSQDDDPHGPDPHGRDPHDERHDPGIPGNQGRNEQLPPNDPYGGDVHNYDPPPATIPRP